MRAQIYKIAGVKNDKEFYKKFPTEEAFMKKHGKAFKKAQDGLMDKVGGLFGGGDGGGGVMDKLGGGAGVVGMAGQAMDIAKTLKGNADKVDSSVQQRRMSTLDVRAKESGLDQVAENEYVRPEDIQNTGEEFFPIYGVGTNVLAQNGAEENKRAHARSAEQARLETIRDNHQTAFNQMSNVFGTVAGSGIGKKAAFNLVKGAPSAYNVMKGKVLKTLGAKTGSYTEGANILTSTLGEDIAGAVGIGSGAVGMGNVAVDSFSGRNKSPKVETGEREERPLSFPSRMVKKGVNAVFPNFNQNGGYMPMAQFGVEQGIEAADQALINKQITPLTTAQTTTVNPNIGIGQSKFSQWMGKGQTENTDAEGNVTQGGQTNAEGVAEGISKIGGAFVAGEKQESAYGKMGKLAGNVAGKFIPIPGAGAVLGKGLELAGKALDPQLKEMEQNQAKIEKNTNIMSGFGSGAKVQAAHSASVQDGGSFSGDLGGNLETYQGGTAETISHNPFLPGNGETVEFKGNMHTGGDNGGIKASYGGNPLEVEGGEPATRLQDGSGEENMVVYGNLTIPKGYDGEGQKFKNYAIDISKKEEDANKTVAKNTEAVADLNVRTSHDILTENSHKYNVIGNNMKLENYAEQKQEAALLQKSINEVAQEGGWVANDLAKGKLKKDTGKFVPSNVGKDGLEMYQDGPKPTAQELLDKGYVADPPNADGSIDYVLMEEGTPSQTIKIKDAVKGQEEISSTSTTAGKVTKGYENQMSNKDWKAYLAKETPEKKAARLKREVAGGYREAGKVGEKIITQEARDFSPAEYETLEGTEGVNDTVTLGGNVPEVQDPTKRDIGGNIMRGINAALPYVRPSDKDAFDRNQLAGEMYALTHNKLEPVKAQKFTPQLDVPYDVSLQDQRNDIVSASNANRRLAQYNPALSGNMAAQEYAALSKVGGEEFRANQAMKHNVYSGNRQTVDKANMTNLGILDQQYVRQEQGKSNTKETNQLALNSIGSKIQQHKLENKELGVYENMYNYRFGANDRAQNYNPLAIFDTQMKNGAYANSSPAQIKTAKAQAEAEAKRIAAGGTNTYVGQNGVKVPLTRALKKY